MRRVAMQTQGDDFACAAGQMLAFTLVYRDRRDHARATKGVSLDLRTG
jgi:hypothetical protein